MAASDKNRLGIFLVFIVLLIAFGVFYRPTDASSRPADKGGPSTTQTTN